MTLPVPLVEISGTPGERGYTYGRAAASRIARSVELYTDALARRAVPWDAVLAAARAFLADIEAREPAFAEEIRAIAEGASVPIEGVVVVNARSEIIHRLGRGPADHPPDGCTGIIVQPEKAADGRLIHAQNWDWMIAARETAILLRVSEPDHEVLTFVEAGGLARCGLNSAGIGLTGNSLKSDRPLPATGLPISLIRRKILASRSFPEALGAVYRSPRGCANNMMISQASGEAVDLETTPQEVFWVEPQDGILVHANHFLSPAARAKLCDVGLADGPDSLGRQIRMERLMRRTPRPDVETVMSALLDRWGAPDGILTLEQTDENGIRIGTVASVVLVPETGDLYYNTAPQESAVFHRARLDHRGGDENIRDWPATWLAGRQSTT